MRSIFKNAHYYGYKFSLFQVLAKEETFSSSLEPLPLMSIVLVNIHPKSLHWHFWDDDAKSLGTFFDLYSQDTIHINSTFQLWWYTLAPFRQPHKLAIVGWEQNLNKHWSHVLVPSFFLLIFLCEGRILTYKPGYEPWIWSWFPVTWV